MLRVGLTGGIGSGKSTVAGRLAEHGATLIDSDKIAREVVAPGTPGLAAVVDAFGDGVLAPDGSLDRPTLAQRVFADDSARVRLNQIVHPLVGARTAELTAEAATDAVVVHDVPLLVENGLAPRYHLVLVVDAPEPDRIRRLVHDRGMTESDVLARIAAQADDGRRRAVADVWLDNSGTPDQVLATVDDLWADRLVPFEANVRLRRMPDRGGPKLVPYHQSWPAEAERLIARLRLAGGSLVSRVDHIGSTSVPGLAAKDVIDIQVTVADLADADALTEPFVGAGFAPLPTYTRDTPHPQDVDPEHWRKRMVANADPGRWCNVHIRADGSPGWRVALLARDWLRAEPGPRADYLAAKEAAADTTRTIGDYADAKQPWFHRSYGEMEAWATRTGWQPG
ncbi:MAG TPA: dephospho-CoA kinase [Pseudonocardiaceae bacterium]|nr:dephospho-CoA kinase [Pseudonocardiaceae bacterium]